MMNRQILTLGLLLISLPLPQSAAPQLADGFQVAGAVAKPAEHSPKALREQFGGSFQLISYARKRVKHTAHAVPLLTVVQAAQPRVSPQIKNHKLQFVILVAGQDGDTAAFSLAELLPEFGNRHAWLAVDEDGRPLGDAAAGEADLVVPEDVKAGRWVHEIARVTVVDEVQAGSNKVQAGNAGKP